MKPAATSRSGDVAGLVRTRWALCHQRHDAVTTPIPVNFAASLVLVLLVPRDVFVSAVLATAPFKEELEATMEVVTLPTPLLRAGSCGPSRGRSRTQRRPREVGDWQLGYARLRVLKAKGAPVATASMANGMICRPGGVPARLR